jgi:hypothetical protein
MDIFAVADNIDGLYPDDSSDDYRLVMRQQELMMINSLDTSDLYRVTHPVAMSYHIEYCCFQSSCADTRPPGW